MELAEQIERENLYDRLCLLFVAVGDVVLATLFGTEAKWMPWAVGLIFLLRVIDRNTAAITAALRARGTEQSK